ncbi:MAG: type transport system permease protein, partial [Actinomycetota bacterium]
MTTMTTTTPRLLPGARRRIRAIALRHAIALWRSPHRLFDVTLWPVVDILLFGTLAVYATRLSGAGDVVVGYVLGGTILWHVVYQSSIGISTGFMEETWTRNLINLMVTPISELEYMAGVALFGAIKICSGVGVATIGGAIAYSFFIGNAGWALIPIAAVLLTVGWAVGLFVIGLVLRFGSGAEALAWGLLFSVMPLSGVFTPVANLPGAIQPVAHALPTTHAFIALRLAINGEGIAWGEIAISAVLASIML